MTRLLAMIMPISTLLFQTVHGSIKVEAGKTLPIGCLREPEDIWIRILLHRLSGLDVP